MTEHEHDWQVARIATYPILQTREDGDHIRYDLPKTTASVTVVCVECQQWRRFYAERTEE